MLIRAETTPLKCITQLLSLTPDELLQKLYNLENNLGRKKLVKIINEAISEWRKSRLNIAGSDELELIVVLQTYASQIPYTESYNKLTINHFDYNKIYSYQNTKTKLFDSITAKNYNSFNQDINDVYQYYNYRVNPAPDTTNNVTDPDMEAILRLLADRITMARLFIKVENEFVAYSREFLGNSQRMFAGNKPHHKLFTSFCKHWARKYGFSDFQKLNDGLSQKEFAAKLIQLVLFDDIAFRGTAHGSASHFMQWAAIVYYYGETKFLSKTPTEIYASIGYQMANTPSVDNWFGVFEIARTTDVFKLNAFLQSNTFRAICPHIAGMIQSREQKGKSITFNM